MSQLGALHTWPPSPGSACSFLWISPGEIQSDVYKQERQQAFQFDLVGWELICFIYLANIYLVVSLDCFDSRSELTLCSVTGFNIRELMFSLSVAAEWPRLPRKVVWRDSVSPHTGCDGSAAPVGPFES